MDAQEYDRFKNSDGLLTGRFQYGFTEFACIVLACSIDGEQYWIEDQETAEGYWCSRHLVDDNYCK